MPEIVIIGNVGSCHDSKSHGLRGREAVLPVAVIGKVLIRTNPRTSIAGAKASRNPDRDTLLILMLFRHGLRESEALLLRRDWLKLDSAQLWVERLKAVY